MYQILPFRLIVVCAIWFAISILIIINWGAEIFGLPPQARYAVIITDFLLWSLTIKAAWTRLWRWIPILRNWFPNLNGKYDVELKHNWPIQEKMLKAAAGDERFNPLEHGINLPELATTNLKAEIDLGFYWIHINMWAEDPKQPGSIIDYSRTLATTLLRPCDGQPHRIAYIYQQKNRRDRRAVSDDSTFEGAAILNIRSDNPKELEGEYWTNRSWDRGLSTAGIIRLKKTG